MSGALLFNNFEKPEGARSGVHQGEWWVTVHGEWVKIEGMTLGHVENVMALLLRRASAHADRESFSMMHYAADAPDLAFHMISKEIDEIERDPKVWMKSTTLYRALKKRRKALRKALKKALKMEPIIEASEVDPGWTWTDEQ